MIECEELTAAISSCSLPASVYRSLRGPATVSRLGRRLQIGQRQQIRLHRFERPRTNASHAAQVVEIAKRTALLAVGDDPSGQFRADVGH